MLTKKEARLIAFETTISNVDDDAENDCFPAEVRMELCKLAAELRKRRDRLAGS
jgi:hypothetical protein